MNNLQIFLTFLIYLYQELNFFYQTLSNENFRFIKLVLKKQIIGFLQFSLNKSDCDIISIGVLQKFQNTLLKYLLCEQWRDKKMLFLSIL